MHQARAKCAGYPPVAEFSNEEVLGDGRWRGTCILCGSVLEKSIDGLFDTRFGIGGNYEVRHCPRCGLEQLSPVPTPAELKCLYESHYNFGGEKDTPYIKLREWFLSSFLYRLWIQLDGDVSFHGRVGTGRLLDIGCNEGRSLKIYARNGFQVEGLELNEAAAAVARRTGHIVLTCQLSELEPSRPYDVAVLSNVLEHSPDPRGMLLEVRRVVKPGGRVWISCPNSHSWLRKVFGMSWINWHVPFHISQFSAASLENLLLETGFANIKIQQISPALWVTHSVIAKIFARKGRPTRELRNSILVVILLILVRVVFFPALWVENWRGHGDCILATANRF